MEKKFSIDRVREASEDIKKAVHRLRLLGEKSLEEFLSKKSHLVSEKGGEIEKGNSRFNGSSDC